MFEDPFGRSPEWIKFAEPSSDTALRFTTRLSRKWPIHPTPSLRSQAGDMAMRSHPSLEPQVERRLIKTAVQRGRSERRGEAYFRAVR